MDRPNEAARETSIVTESRIAFAAIETALSHLPDFVKGVQLVDGRLEVRIATAGRAFNHRGQLGHWFMHAITIPLLASKSIQGLPLFRGVTPAGLSVALRQGIDVTPTDAHWYGGALDKALEYGGDYPSVLIIERGRTERTFRQVEADAPPEEHEAARRVFGINPIPSHDGKYYLYSRLPVSDNRRGTPYEFRYAHYIPGDARMALIGYIVCEEMKI